MCADCNAVEFKNGTENDHAYTTVTHAPNCQEQGYDEKTCSTCGKMVKVNYQNTVDHAWQSAYLADTTFHWIKCKDCDEITSRAEHTEGADGFCTVCDQPLGPTTGVLYDLSADSSYAMVIGYEGTAKRVIIADTYQGKPVTEIYREAFQSNKSITTVVIPDSVEELGVFAFYECTGLTSVVIPDNVTSIGISAFYYCTGLTSVVIGDSVKSIGSYAFDCCWALTSVYYVGSASEWSDISIGDWGNDDLTDATRYYYSASEPTTEGKYWRYVNGMPTAW